MNQYLFLACNLACYSIFFMLNFSSWKNGSNKLFNKKDTALNPGTLTGLMIAGILWLGVIPMALSNHSPSVIMFGSNHYRSGQFLILFLMFITVILIGIIQSSHEFLRFALAKNNLTLFSSAFLLQYFPARVLFLIAYETWFRGIFLFACISSFGTVAAIIINITLYALLHVFSNKKEMWACIPFGTLLCCTAIWFQAVWPAVVLHAALAVAYETNLVLKSSIKLKTVL